MSAQASTRSLSLDDLASGADNQGRSTRNPTAQELLEAFMNETTATADEAKLYRGRSTAELIPKIQAELGPQAIVTARRSGLEGGIGGFFQRPFVEIEALKGNPGVDIHDGEDALPPAPQPQAPTEPAAHADAFPRLSPAQAPVREPSLEPLPNGLDLAESEPFRLPGAYAPAPAPVSFAAALEDASALEAPKVPGPYEAQRAPASMSASPAHAALREELLAKGFSESFAAAVLDEASTHVLSFNPRLGLRRAVRVAIERRIPKAAPLSGHGASIALLGPGGVGKSACQEALAGRYRQGALPVTCAAIVQDPDNDTLALIAPPAIAATPANSKRAQAALAGAREQGIVLLDTPSLPLADAAAVRGLGQALSALGPDSRVIVLPATMSSRSMANVLSASAPLGPSGLAITHVEESEELGLAVEAACHAGIAPEYLLSLTRGALALTRTDPGAIAKTLLP